jgi:Protein of unknown function (DUF2510)
MQEFASVSASSYDPAALAAKLTEKSAEGWSVVSIVPTGGDVTAFLAREASGATAEPAAAVVEAAPVTTPEPQAEPMFAPVLTPMPVSTPEPAPAVAEPAGWGVAPEAAAPAMAPIVDPTPASTYQPAAQTYQPAAQSYQPAAQTAPAVPAGWYADPAGRFELRYWDGSTWTEHVSRAGQQYTDPPVA